MPNEIDEPKLEKPGAGLPFFEWAFAKYILFPRRFKSVTTEAALSQFAVETKAIQALIAPLAEADLSKRRLIPRLPGLEDSSRYWSTAMTLQHLVIVLSGMKDMMVGLTKGIAPKRATSTADVKPSTDVNAATIAADFENVSRVFMETVAGIDLGSSPNTKYPHPWFGPLNAKQWLVIAASHQQLHRKQVSEIAKRL